MDALAAMTDRMDRVVDRLAGDALRFDPHTHLGTDEDGMAQTPAELIAAMDEQKVARAIAFPLHDPDRGVDYRVPNDRVLEWAAASDGRIVPFCRLSLDGDPIAEARRAIAAGARGIKLHPRAQAFAVDDERLEPIFAVAAEHRLPILIHAGRGMPPIGDQLSVAAERNPDAVLILAHAAIVDQDRIAALVQGRPNIVFDTSAWSPIDLFALFSRVPPEQVVWASDLPYGTMRESLFATLAVLHELDASPDLVRAVLGGTTAGLVEGRQPVLSPSPLGHPERTLSLTRLRLSAYLIALLPVLWQRRPDFVGHFGLAAGVCRDAEDDLAPCGELIALAEEHWTRALEQAEPDKPTLEDVRGAFELVLTAWVLAVCPRTMPLWEESA